MGSPSESFRTLATANWLISELPARTYRALPGNRHGTAPKEPIIARRLLYLFFRRLPHRGRWCFERTVLVVIDREAATVPHPADRSLSY
jgi:hypothetical protein